MSEKFTDEQLRDWERQIDIDGALSDCVLTNHFEACNLPNWVDVAEEGRRIWNLMFNDSVEVGSAVDAVITAIAAASAQAAINSLARKLAMDADALRDFVEENDTKPTWTIEEFAREVAEHEKAIKEAM